MKTSVAYNELLVRAHARNKHQRAPGRVQRLAHRLGRQRPSRRGWLVVRPARLDPASPAPYPSVWPTPCSRRCATRRFGEPAWHARNAKRFGYGCSRSARWSPEMPAPSRSGSPAPAPTKPCSDCSYAGSPPDNPGPRRNDPENDPQSDLGAPRLASRRRRGSKASHTTVSTAPSRPAGPSEIPSCVLLSLYFNKLIFIHLTILSFDNCAPNTAQWLARRRSTPSLSD